MSPNDPEMAPATARRRSDDGRTGPLRRAALLATVAGAIGSVALTLYAGRQQESRVLMTMFAIWVVSPFGALALANVRSARWSAATRAALHWVMVVVAVGSLVIYGANVLQTPRPRAFLFLVVPLTSWLLAAVAVSMAARRTIPSAQKGL